MRLQVQHSITRQPSWKTTIPPLTSSRRSHRSSNCWESAYPSQLRTQNKCHRRRVQLVNKTKSCFPAYSYAVQRIVRFHQSTIMRCFQLRIDKAMVSHKKMAIWQLSWDPQQVYLYPQLLNMLSIQEKISTPVCLKDSMEAWCLHINKILRSRWLSPPRHLWWKICLISHRC